MHTRRDFCRTIAAAGLAGACGPALAGHSELASGSGAATSAGNDRDSWVDLIRRVSLPVLQALAQRRLKATMPVEAHEPAKRAPYTHLEAVGRLLNGIAPWLELNADCGNFVELAQKGIAAAVDPASPDFLNFHEGQQPLVDAAFLAEATLRAPTALWHGLVPSTRDHLLNALEATRTIKPYASNWELFAAVIEVALHRGGRKRDDVRLFRALRDFRTWYLGDGWYGDGREFHWDYYNAYVIQPMLVDILDAVGDDAPEWREFREQVHHRFQRFAVIQERLIAPDGAFPAVGRSITYRCGAFQGLALAALRHELPETVKPAQARAALTSVVRRTLEAPGTFDANGWLRIGLAGHQPDLAEDYISTGSLYLCSFAFLPLGLTASDAFWSDPPAPTTWQQVWSGANLPADHAL